MEALPAKHAAAETLAQQADHLSKDDAQDDALALGGKQNRT